MKVRIGFVSIILLTNRLNQKTSLVMLIMTFYVQHLLIFLFSKNVFPYYMRTRLQDEDQLLSLK